MGTEVLRPKDCLQPGPLLAHHRKPNPSPSKPVWTPKKRPDKLGAGSHVVAGQVTILKRGEPQESSNREREVVFGTGLLGPNPERMPRRTRLARPKGAAADENVYAGTAFASSPAPSALPLPTFSRRKDSEANVAYLATKDLRRLLGLD